MLESDVRTIPASIIEFSGSLLNNNGAASDSERRALPVAFGACLLTGVRNLVYPDCSGAPLAARTSGSNRFGKLGIFLNTVFAAIAH